MKNFRKKPIEVEAWQLPVFQYADRNKVPAPAFMAESIQRGIVTLRPSEDGSAIIYIQTLEGRMKASPLDWIVQGPKGELYPVKPDIFEITYEPI